MIEPSTNPTARTEAELRALMARAVHEVRETNPLAPSITNTVTQNFVANAQLAVGGSAAMVYLPDEGECVAALGGAVYINLGTLLPVYEQTVPATARACAAAGKPWVLDPVGIGIGSLRTQLIEAVRENPPAILRGNASEIIAVAELWGLAVSYTHLDVYKRQIQKTAGNLAVELVVLHEQNAVHRAPPAARTLSLIHI